MKIPTSRYAGRSWLLLCVLLFSGVALANDPGGGAAGAGGNVTLATSSTTATLDNGIIQAVIEKSTGRVTSYKLSGTQMVDPANPIYYSMDGGTSFDVPSGCVFSTVINTPDHVEVACKRTWNAGAGYKHVFDIDLHYVLRRGDTGLYAFAILDHPAAYPAATVGEWRIVWKLPRTSTTFTFERAYVDSARNWEMPSYYDYQHALPTAIGEIVKLTTGVRAGLFDGKYTYSARYFDIGTWGHASNISKKGVWFVLGGQDYFNDGPTKQDLTSSESYILMHFGRNHYDGAGIAVADGEAWRKIFGPFLLYCNATSASSNAGDVLWADAKAQLAAEKAAWPYAWLNTADHPAASARGSVTGRLIITDPLKPSLTSANAFVGLAASEDTDGNWQYQAKKYQYWTRADASGNFTISAVRPGTYTLYAFNDGAVGEYSKPEVTVTVGGASNLGSLTWSVPRSGASIAWEIGSPDRTAKEFLHGNDYFTPFLWNVYPNELSNPLVFNVGTDNPATSWNYVHSGYPTTVGGVTTWGPWDWKIKFNLAAVPDSGNALLTFAIASSNYARLFLYLNDDTAAFTRISPANDGGNALLRQGIHAKYSVVRVSIPVAKLRTGANTFTLRESPSGTGDHVMYDYIGLELPAFPPPPPSSGKTIVWKGGGNATANTWDNATTSSFLNGVASTTFGTGDAVVLDSSGSNATAITLTGSLEPNSVSVNATKDYILAGTGNLTGQMGLTKAGIGKLTLSSANSFAGPTTIISGTLAFANDAANAGALGTSDITLLGGTIAMYSNFGTYNNSSWDIDVPTGSTGTLTADARCDLFGKLTGGGTFNFVLPNGSIRTSVHGDWSGFSGQIYAKTGTTADFRMSLDYAWPGLPSAALDLGAGISAYYAGNLNDGIGTIVSFGELSGEATALLRGGATAGRQITYRVGGVNTDATFAGSISEQTNGYTNLVKTGTGIWTLSGTSSINGTSTVEGGTVRVTGSLSHGATAIVEVRSGGTLDVTGNLTAAAVHVAEGGKFIGPGRILGDLMNDGQAICEAGTLTVDGSVTNNGLLRLAGGAAIAVSGVFTNYGILDLINGNASLPAGFVNNGLILTARGPAGLVWTGASNSNWDDIQSANWLNGSSADVFRTGDSVTFDDAPGVADLTLVGTLAPGSVTVNASNTFSFGGTGILSGNASLTKSGTGLLTIAGSHPLTGNISVTGGTLQLGLAAGFPNASGFAVGPGATLDVSGLMAGFTVGAGQRLSGAGTVVGALTVRGSLIPGPGILNVTGNLTLAASTPIVLALGTSSSRVAVTGNLTLGGQLTATAGTGFGPGTYTILSYTGSLAMVPGGLSLASVPGNFTCTISTATAGQVNLVISLSPYQQWQVLWFGDYNSPVAADSADPDGDGEINMMEFASGQNPKAATTSRQVLERVGGNLEFTYTRSRAALASGWTFAVEWSDSLAGTSWSTTGVSETILSDNGTLQSVKAILPAGSAPRRFVHLRVSKP